MRPGLDAGGMREVQVEMTAREPLPRCDPLAIGLWIGEQSEIKKQGFKYRRAEVAGIDLLLRRRDDQDLERVLAEPGKRRAADNADGRGIQRLLLAESQLQCGEAHFRADGDEALAEQGGTAELHLRPRPQERF